MISVGLGKHLQLNNDVDIACACVRTFVGWQFMVFGHVALIPSAAAREGARAAAAYESAHGAVARSVGSYDYRVSGGACGAPGSPVRVTVRLRIPIIDIPYVPVPEMWTKHTATMRCEPPWK